MAKRQTKSSPRRAPYSGVLASPLPDLRPYIERLPEDRRALAKRAWQWRVTLQLRRAIGLLFAHYDIAEPELAALDLAGDPREQTPWMIGAEAEPWFKLALALAADHVPGVRVEPISKRGRKSRKWPEHRLAALWVCVARTMIQIGKQEGVFVVLGGDSRWCDKSEDALEAAWRRAQRDVLSGVLEIAPTTIKTDNDRHLLEAFARMVELFFPQS